MSYRGAPPFRDPGRYEILGEHGRGGLGRVSRARDKDLGRDIAVKELLKRGHVNELRFAREAITAHLEHPGIVPLYEAGRWPDGTPFYAMKLVSGRSLREILAERDSVDERIILLHHVIAVADAMAYAHGRNIIHRDLKPANVIVGDFGETVVIDWGLAKDLSDAAELGGSDDAYGADDNLTSAGSVLGTPAYMAPEQERGERVDQRADVFAIGAMLWELCSLQKVPPSNPAQRRRMFRQNGIDQDLATIVDKALESEPGRRYRDAGALAADLKAFKSGVRIAARSYSLWAMLAHWTRRHRTLALSVTIALMLAVAGGVVFVRNIALERDRADKALVSARNERDRARLSEASLILATDPTRSRELLSSFVKLTPQVALLTSQTRQLGASRVVRVSSNIEGLYHATENEGVEVQSIDGLRRLDPGTGALSTLDQGAATTAFSYRAGQSAYTRQSADFRQSELVVGDRVTKLEISDRVWQLATLLDATYLLDVAGDLQRIGPRTTTLVDRGIHGIAGDGDTLLLCRRTGELEVRRHGRPVFHTRCAQSRSQAAMAVVHDDWAVLTDDGGLVTSVHGRLRELATEIRGEYELALSDHGVLAIADYGPQGGTWFIGPDGRRLEPGPARGPLPFSVAADGDLVAWGYFDGTLIALDTVHGMRWELHGHTSPAQYIALDAQRARVISASRREIRVWEIKSPPTTLIADMPCSVFHVEPSPTGDEEALDCNDGSVWRWSRASGLVQQLHRHVAYSFGLTWFRGGICSGGWGDGHVLCSRPDGSVEPTEDTQSWKVGALKATSDGATLIFTGDDGTVWRLDRTARRIYKHANRVYGASLSPDGHRFASCAQDGSIAVYDLTVDRVVAHTFAHRGAYCGVLWTGDELWSTGDDGTLKRWRVIDGELRLVHMLQTGDALRMLQVVRGAWAAVEGADWLLFGDAPAAVAMRISLGGTVSALGMSGDQRYIAASVNTEIVVIDVQRHSIANVAVGMPVRQLRFLEPALLAFSDARSLKTMRVDRLDYVPFEWSPEPPNRASF